MSIELVPLGTLEITIQLQTRLEGVPAGTRMIGEAADCRWVGDRVRARQRGGAASDWLLVNPDGTATVDARILLETDDGAFICLRYTGRARLPLQPGDAVITAPIFETNDERYAWLNSVQAIAKGQRQGDVIVYELYRVT